MLVAKDTLFYLLIRLATYPLRWMPYSWIQRLGQAFGTIGFFFLKTMRKRTLSNLSLAKDLSLKPREIIQIAKESFQNLAITCLEYSRLDVERELSRVIQCENPEEAEALYRKGQGIVFFCGHQANWEVLFLDGTSRMRGVAIGKPAKNRRLYRWVVSIRERWGGKIIAPRDAMKEALRALKSGAFIGIVGDQGMPGSGYSFPFFGRRAFTTTAPALLAHKTNSPIIVATTRRVRGGYRLRYAEPLWPDLTQPLEEEVRRLMDRSLSLLQESIKENPGQWLWQHNRWKQQTPKNLYKPFRHDCVCAILPRGDALPELAPHLPTLKKIYTPGFFFLIVPIECKGLHLCEAEEIFYYSSLEETLRDDFRFKLVFNFTDFSPIAKHYKRLAAFDVLDLPTLKKLALPHLPKHLENSPSEIFKRALCRPGSIWRNDALLH